MEQVLQLLLLGMLLLLLLLLVLGGRQAVTLQNAVEDAVVVPAAAALQRGHGRLPLYMGRISASRWLFEAPEVSGRGSAVFVAPDSPE